MIGLATAVLAAGAEVKQALAVDVPAGWEMKYKGEKGLQFYTVTRKEGDTALLMFSRWPAPGNAAQIPDLIENMAKAFSAEAKKNPDFQLENEEYVIENIEGGTFSGKFVKFSVKGGVVQTMFMIGDGDGIWNGQFTGTKERWADALGVLKKLKKND